MRLNRFLSKKRIVDIQSTSLEGAIKELLATIPEKIMTDANKRTALVNILEREKSMSTYLGNGVCMPHTRIKGLKQKYIFAVGRCPNGLTFSGSIDDTYSKTRTLFLLLSDEDAVLSLSAALSSESERLNVFKTFKYESTSSSESKRNNVRVFE